MKKKRTMFEEYHTSIIAHVIACIVLLGALSAMVYLPGCSLHGGKQLTTAERLRVSSYGAGEIYLKAYEAYGYLQERLPADAKDKLQEFAGPLNDARQPVIDYLALAISVSEGDEAGVDVEERQQEVRARVVNLLTGLVELGIKYGVDVEEEIQDAPND